MHCLFTKCELHEQSRKANSEFLFSHLSTPDVRPQARCVFACLPGNMHMHPGMSWDLVPIAEVESTSPTTLLPGSADASGKVWEASLHHHEPQRRTKPTFPRWLLLPLLRQLLEEKLNETPTFQNSSPLLTSGERGTSCRCLRSMQFKHSPWPTV